MRSGRNKKWYYRKAIAFSSMVALVLGQTSVLAGAVLGQSVSGIKTPKTYAQLPSFSPPNPVPVPPFANPDQPLPPVGYPGQPSNITPPDQFSRYRLGVGDAIAVSVPRFPDLSFQSNVDLDGNIVVPLVGTLQVAGLTLEQVQTKIQAGLNRFVIDPQVIVSLAALRAAQVTITGEVLRPGYYPLQPGSQLSAALLAAGGTTTSADLRTIVVRRRSLADNSFVEQQIDLFTPLQNGTSLPNLRLQDGDAVIVSKLEVGNTSDYDRSLVSRSSVAQQQINVRVLSYAGRGIGNLTLPNGSTFVDALAAIAPNPDNANLGRIALIRFDPEQGKAVTQELNGKRALRGDVSQNVPLQNNDVIVVGRNFISRITYALSNFTQPFRDILGFLLFFDSLRESATNLFEPGSDDNDD
ncbi:polysaccharide export protein [Microcoleus sp. FACHB-SPT15]|uniref:polysaccharide biosynthesis/export family protein n=1 Tax=Microcoleus sp. FACHB-SPT15 TaxID=2692830 RepID=UPI0017857431|nr:polysaccharide biosynthesis/export family protein [Microcoleus sp. FACHB-SPT15]MBD1808841.1 polysaccharide export protein [Microcoleus sp. FACHB-SPT15]